MSSFVCEHCGAEIIDTPRGYISGCEHYPLERTNAELQNAPDPLLRALIDSAGAPGRRATEKPPLDDGMVIYAARYALGRASYAPDEVAYYLVCHWDKLQPKTQAVIVRDIEEAIAQGRSGMEMDRAEWMKVLERARR